MEKHWLWTRWRKTFPVIFKFLQCFHSVDGCLFIGDADRSSIEDINGVTRKVTPKIDTHCCIKVSSPDLVIVVTRQTSSSKLFTKGQNFRLVQIESIFR